MAGNTGEHKFTTYQGERENKLHMRRMVGTCKHGSLTPCNTQELCVKSGKNEVEELSRVHIGKGIFGRNTLEDWRS